MKGSCGSYDVVQSEMGEGTTSLKKLWWNDRHGLQHCSYHDVVRRKKKNVGFEEGGFRIHGGEMVV